MPNDFYTRAYSPLPEQRVSSQVLKDEFARVEAGFDEVQGDANRAIKLPVGTADQTLAMDAGARANLVLAFDAAGNISAISYGRWKGDWATATAYVVSDYFRDPVSKNIYATVTAHTAGVLADDITTGRVRLAINVADLEAARAAAAASAATAADQVVLAADQVVLAASQADAARAIANFAGVWSTLTGPLSKPATVYHAGLFYVLVNSLANVALSEPGVTADWIASGGGGMPSYAYDQRASLRASGGQFAVVDGLGLFQHVAGSDEPDDDESCFATATGRWLLQAASWDLVDAWQLPEVEERDAYDEDEPLRFASKVLTGTATCSITSVANVASTSFTGTVTGAALGDRVIATPPAELGANAGETGRLGYHAWVSAANTVTVMLTNPSASVANTNTAIRTAWPITVIKS